MITKKTAWLFILPLFFMGCDKFLDKVPENKVSVDEIFSDLPGAKAALTGVYLSMWGSGYGNGPRMVYPEAVGGNVKLVGIRQTLTDVYGFTAQADSSSMNAVYKELYTMLNNINNIITRVPFIEKSLETERNDLLAQAYGLRALLHFDLVQLYAQPYGYSADASHPGIVLATAPILVSQAQQKRATVGEVYTQLEQDLINAQNLFKNSKSVFTGRRSSYMNAAAVQALQARIALHKGDWVSAYNHSATVIADNFSLYSSAEYGPSWKTMGAKETIFELAVPSNFSGNSLGNYYTADAGNVYYQFAPSEDLLALFSEGDLRGSGGGFKYDTYATAAPSVKLFRLSEMYLIRAEAAVELQDQEGALSDLNAIRLRGNPTLARWTVTTKELLTAEIMNERRRELCLEGFFFFDLTRRGSAVVRTDCMGPNCTVSYPSAKFVLPIPQQTVNSNQEMKQNPGY